jgi:ligand-binding SRPBCC domain-containing protein
LSIRDQRPYKYWRHTHEFEDLGNQTLMRDRVQYELPFGILGTVTHRLVVARQLEGIFDYRARKIRKLFAKQGVPAAESTNLRRTPE